MSVVVQKAADQATKIALPSEEEVASQIQVINGKMADVKAAQKDLLPVEKAYALPILKKQIDTLDAEKKVLAAIKPQRKYADFFPKLSLECLTWRNTKV